MKALELKNDIHKYVVETDDLMILQQVKDLFQELTSKSVELTDYEIERIEKGLKDIEEGRVYSNEEVRAKIDKWIAEKQA